MVHKKIIKVSIITVCLNEEDHISTTINSILDQTYKNFELIVVDGGSTDQTLKILNGYSKSIDVFIKDRGEGIYNAMNSGIAAASGEYIHFMNGGDWYNDDDVLHRIFTANPTEDVLYGKLTVRERDGKEYVLTPPSSIDVGYLSARTIPHPSSLVKITLFHDVGVFDESYRIAADYDFFLRAFLKQSVTTFYFSFTFAVFNTDGISSSENHNNILEEERKRTQKSNLPFTYFIIARLRAFLTRHNQNTIAQTIQKCGIKLYEVFRLVMR